MPWTFSLSDSSRLASPPGLTYLFSYILLEVLLRADIDANATILQSRSLDFVRRARYGGDDDVGDGQTFFQSVVCRMNHVSWMIQTALSRVRRWSLRVLLDRVDVCGEYACAVV